MQFKEIILQMGQIVRNIKQFKYLNLVKISKSLSLFFCISSKKSFLITILNIYIISFCKKFFYYSIVLMSFDFKLYSEQKFFLLREWSSLS